MTNRRIIYNRNEDSGVSVCCPTDWALTAMCSGGAWREFPWFYPGFDKVQIERMIKRGIRADVAQIYARAMMEGGCTTAEALEIIRDRDCAPVGTAIELWAFSDVPTDLWFRDAWKRSHNGGPIYVDLEKAKPIQFGHVRQALSNENLRRRKFDVWKSPLELDLDRFRQRVLEAESVDQLRLLWPKELN